MHLTPSFTLPSWMQNDQEGDDSPNRASDATPKRGASVNALSEGELTPSESSHGYNTGAAAARAGAADIREAHAVDHPRRARKNVIPMKRVISTSAHSSKTPGSNPRTPNPALSSAQQLQQQVMASARERGGGSAAASGASGENNYRASPATSNLSSKNKKSSTMKSARSTLAQVASKLSSVGRFRKTATQDSAKLSAGQQISTPSDAVSGASPLVKAMDETQSKKNSPKVPKLAGLPPPVPTPSLPAASSSNTPAATQARAGTTTDMATSPMVHKDGNQQATFGITALDGSSNTLVESAADSIVNNATTNTNSVVNNNVNSNNDTPLVGERSNTDVLTRTNTATTMAISRRGTAITAATSNTRHSQQLLTDSQTDTSGSKHVSSDVPVGEGSGTKQSESSGGAYTAHSGDLEPTPASAAAARSSTTRQSPSRQGSKRQSSPTRRGSGSAGRSVISSTIHEEDEQDLSQEDDKENMELSISSPRASSLEDLHGMRKWASPSSRSESKPPIGLFRPHVDVEALMKREQEKEDQVVDLKQKLKTATDQAAGAMLSGFERYAVAQKMCEDKINESNERFAKQQTLLEDEREILQKKLEQEITARHEMQLHCTDLENQLRESDVQAQGHRKELASLRVEFKTTEGKLEESDQKLLSIRQEKLSYEAGHMREQTRLKSSLEEAWERLEVERERAEKYHEQLIEAQQRRQEAEERRASALASVEELRNEIARSEQAREHDMKAAEKLCAAYQSMVEKLQEDATMRQANNVAVTTREHVHSDLSNPFAFVEKVGISGLFDDVKSNDHPEQASASASGYPQTKQERMDLINSLREAELPSRLKRAVAKNVADPFRVSVGDPFAHIGQRGEGGLNMFDDLDLDLPQFRSPPPPPLPEDGSKSATGPNNPPSKESSLQLD